MNNEEIIQKIMKKKEFSKLPLEDVKRAFSNFERRQTTDEEKVKLTREYLMKIFSGFASSKLMNVKDKSFEWVLKRHASTRERFDFYSELYRRLLKDYKKVSIIDLGCGVNGFSYEFFEQKVDYTGVEAMGQLVDLMNFYFKKEKFSANAIHESLFELDKIKKLVEGVKEPSVVFLFKVIDALEVVERNYSKDLLNELVPLVDRVVVSFPTKSLVAKKNFKVKRYWFENFVKENFEIVDDFELGTERYIVFRKK